MRSRAAAALLLAAATAACLTTGCATRPAAGSAPASTAEASPTAAFPEAAIRQTLAGLDGSMFADVRLGPPPAVSTGSGYPGQWLYATLTDTSGSVPLALWEGMLAQGAIAERLAGDTRDLRHVVSGSQFRDAAGTDDDGRLDSGMGDARAGRVYTAADSTDAQLIEQARQVLAAYDVTAEEVRVLHPLDPALLVRVSLPDAAAMHGRFAQLVTALEGSGAGAGLDFAGSRDFEGSYVELDAPAGTPVAVGWNALRTASGGQWWAPGDSESALGMFPHG